MKKEGKYLQARERRLTRNKPCQHFYLGFQHPEPLSVPPVCGILWWQAAFSWKVLAWWLLPSLFALHKGASTFKPLTLWSQNGSFCHSPVHGLMMTQIEQSGATCPQIVRCMSCGVDPVSLLTRFFTIDTIYICCLPML